MIYAEVMNQIEQLIDSGELKPGKRLPSIRSLAKRFGCSVNTIIKAYSELEKKHKIYSVSKSGYYVVERVPSGHSDSTNTGFIDFLSAGPDKNAMPYRDYQHCINQAIEVYKEEMFTYSEIQGLPSLREELARHLRDLQVFTVSDRICVVSGSQQAIHLLISLPFPNGKKNICVEQPTHVSMIESIKYQQATTYGIEITDKGLDMDRLEHLFKYHEIKCFYTVTRFQNPTGYSYSNKERRKIVELAQKYDVYIIEDDYLGDLDPDKNQDPMFTYDPSGRVIYIKSFSKVMLPGLRLGLAVIPDFLRDSFLSAKFATDLHTPVLTQAALEIYLKSGMFKAHIQRMRSIYRRKAALLQKAYQEKLPPGAAYSGSDSGFYSTIRLPSPLKARTFIEDLKKENVYVDDARKMYLPEFVQDSVIRLSVSQVEEKHIEIGVQTIARVIQEQLSSVHTVKFI
ncbi:PLP-dependent aminotransferase family protein [Paenibacillus sp. XY044]|uniref:aminotransferase-like domain-containing protein n=1 Tax=Paenibacillus sp. XY044 TaxID=2026089 RepID=UPI000B9936DB|nr:PLP-dependent aminotransferase family protein [Paenibacillus sp. XY044]OZB96151.1 GntR family transcriptional regulator [Paenibacillus sp. XY044]